MATIHDLTMSSITGESVDLGSMKGNVLLIVNVASA
jgi:glutathione peroxidase-family protein